jgi:hypothetical protein
MAALDALWKRLSDVIEQGDRPLEWDSRASPPEGLEDAFPPS